MLEELGGQKRLLGEMAIQHIADSFNFDEHINCHNYFFLSYVLIFAPSEEDH
jgi:hypothetical protein